MRELLQNACYGPGSYFQSNHMAVLVLGTLLYFFVADRKTGALERRLLGTTAVLLALVLFPVSAVALMLYQTRFYVYHWIWSLVPVTLCIAWGSVELLWELTAQKRRDGRTGFRLAVGVTALLALLLLMGNMGNVRTVTEEEKIRQQETRQAAVYLEELPGMEETLLWAPRSVLEAVRRQTGEIRLLYGRNMWEPEAAAYAYDSYPMEQQRLFDWMEMLERGDAYEVPLGLRIFLEDVVAYPAENTTESNRILADAYMLQLAAEYGALVWVFPEEATERVTLACGPLYEKYGLRAQQLGEIGDYTVWCCDRDVQEQGKNYE